jgi:hypothetical protein
MDRRVVVADAAITAAGSTVKSPDRGIRGLW